MSGQEYRKGEVVDVRIEGARVCSAWSSDGQDWAEVESGGGLVLHVNLSDDAVTVTRVAPPEWPPRRADVWIDGDKDAWFAPVDGQLRALTGSHTPVDADEVLKTYGRMRLAHRKEGESGE